MELLKPFFRTVGPFISRYRFSVLATFFCFGLGTILAGVILPFFYKELIDVITVSDIATEAGRGELAPQLFRVVLYIALLNLGFNTLFRTADFTITFSQSKIQEKLANDMFTKITRHSYGFFADNFSGALVAKARRFLSAFESMYDTVVFHFWNSGLLLIATFIALFLQSPTIGLVFFGWLMLYIIGILIFVRFQMRFDIAETEVDSNVTARIADVFTNMLNLKVFSSRRREIISFENLTATQERLRRRAWNISNFRLLFSSLMIGLLEVVTLYLAVRFFIAGEVSAGTIVLVNAYMFAIFGAVWPLARGISRFSRSLAEAKELIDILEKPRSVNDPDDPEPLRMGKGAVRFKNVRFAYEGDGFTIFKEFNLSIPAGQRVGLVGQSGAGKSTITKILLRFADVSGGEVTIDGQNIASVTEDDLRSIVSYVPQEPVLFHRTIRENILYGKPDATEEELVEAAKKARAHDFIMKLPFGYDTLVGERGVKLSGGERQRVAIARAILENAPVLVLDEATSSLDSESEKLIQDALEELMEGKTAIVIAHRLSTIQNLDRIVVLEAGKVLEDGDHASLIARRGRYFTFYTHQHGGFIE